MSNQIKQSNFVRRFDFLSPFTAVQAASMLSAGTDIRTHHRFLREAEAIRFQFVQDLNKVHETDLAYSDDIKRSSDHASEQRTRMSAENWKILKDFRFKPQAATDRLNLMMPSVFVLIFWIILASLLGWLGARRLLDVENG